MGWYLKRKLLQIETRRVAVILISILVPVMISETVSAWARGLNNCHPRHQAIGIASRSNPLIPD